MPVIKTKLKSGKVRVSTPGGIKAKAAPPANASAQERLLNAVEHGWKPTGQPARPAPAPRHIKRIKGNRKPKKPTGL